MIVANVAAVVVASGVVLSLRDLSFVPREVSLAVSSLAGIAAAIAFLARRDGRPSMTELRPDRERLLVAAVGCAAVIVAMSVADVGPGFAGSATEWRALGPRLAVFGLIYTTALMPALEELLFRRYVLEILSRRFSVGVGVLGSVLIHTSLHPVDLVAMSLLAAGFAICSVAYLRAGVLPAIIVHGLYNLLVWAMAA